MCRMCYGHDLRSVQFVDVRTMEPIDLEQQQLDNAIKLLMQTKDSIKAYKETANEILQCYINCHKDSWMLEQALRRISNKSLDESDNLGESNVEEQRQVATEALETVWKCREERSKS